MIAKTTLARASPLAHAAVRGRFGADRGFSDVELSVRHPASIVGVIARKGCSDRVAAALNGIEGAPSIGRDLSVLRCRRWVDRGRSL